ncbi:hypothetical protein Pmar_PMAR004385, partial [Perkinsus marinus ATCC 50983]
FDFRWACGRVNIPARLCWDSPYGNLSATTNQRLSRMRTPSANTGSPYNRELPRYAIR